MPIHVPKHIQEIANYKPGKPNADMFEGKTNERSAILCSNENNFGTSPLALQAIQEAFSQLYLYPDPTGDALKAAIEQHYGYPNRASFLEMVRMAYCTLFSKPFLSLETIFSPHTVPLSPSGPWPK
jgi:hypothetical protein